MKSFTSLVLAAVVAVSAPWSVAEASSVRGRSLVDYGDAAAPTVVEPVAAPQQPAYPLNVAEAQGAIIGHKFYIFSGFHDAWTTTTNQNYALDLTDLDAGWTRLEDDLPALGITAAATVVAKGKFYMCGGYLGGSPGPQTNECLVYDPSHTAGSKWSYMEPLPGVGRAGGGLVYDSARNALIFAGGAVRTNVCEFCYQADDYSNTWIYYFDYPESGWTAKADLPFLGNHLASVTVKCPETGNERHFFVGGQQGEVGLRGVNDHHYEYMIHTDTWEQRASLPMPRSHMMGSTHALEGQNGYVVAGGRTTGGVELTDISFYDVANDKWTPMGNLPQAVHSPVCDIYENVVYCQTGTLEETTASLAQQVAL